MKTNDPIIPETLKMNNIQSIIRALASYELNNNNYGLHHGKMGLVMAYFMLSSTLNQDIYAAKAENLIGELTEAIGSITDLTFENGLSGIGYGIEWIVQHGFIDADTDEILADLDDQMYRQTLYSRSENLSLSNGTISKAMYFYKRIMAKNPNTIRYRELCNEECMVLLMQEISELITSDQYGAPDKKNLHEKKIMEIAQATIFTLYMSGTRFNSELNKKNLCDLLTFSDNYLTHADYTHKQTDSALYLIYSCIKTGRILKDNHILTIGNKALISYADKGKKIQSVSRFKNHLFLLTDQLNNKPQNQDTFRQTSDKPEIFDITASISGIEGFKFNNWGEAWGL